MRRFRLLPASALVAMLLAGCGDDDTASSPPPSETTAATARSTAVTDPPAPVGGLLATIGTNRLYTIDRGFGLGLQNVGDQPVVVRGVQLESDLFGPAPAATREVLLEPGGRRFVLPLPYGEARCDGDRDPTFTAVVVVDDGEELRVPAIEEYAGAVGRVHSRECAAADIRERVDIDFGDEWTRDGVTITGELLLDQRHPGPPVGIDDAVGNVIFTLHFEEGPPVVRVSDDEPSAAVPVTISADRCDPHALAEVKRPFVFLGWATVGDGDSVPLELAPTGAARAALEDLFATC